MEMISLPFNWSRGWPHNPMCEMCRLVPETAVHLFSDCAYAVGVWSHIMAQWNILATDTHYFQKWRSTTRLLSRTNQISWHTSWAATCWSIWRERNRRIFTNKRRPHRLLVMEINSLSDQWLKHC
ncbi:hypothetical protein LUZ60_010626 [Juncus effusus]|nr:hypothetical protein LUZ60_010626 [Juncus effusus]